MALLWKKYNFIISQDKFYSLKHLSNAVLSLKLSVKEFYMVR